MAPITKFPKVQKAPINVAIVDDYIMLRELLVENINSFSECNVVLSAGTGKELIEGLEQLEILPDVCIIDISMPKMNGYEVQLVIKERWPEIKSLALSIYDDAACIIQMFKNGANGFVTKQSSPKVLYEAILTVFSGNDYYKQLPVTSIKQTKYLPNFKERESEFLILTCQGLTPEKIADKMNISPRTLEHYRDNIYRELNVNCKADLLFYVIRTGIVYLK